MALDDIFHALDEQADRDIEQILDDAREQAKAIAEEASENAKAIKEGIVADAERAARARAAKSVNAARLDAKKRLASVKEEAIQEVFEAAEAKLSQLRSGSAYPAVFRALAEEAVRGMDGELEVLVDPADVALAESTLRDLGVSAEVKPEIRTAGGLAVRTGGGRVMRRNTFEDRLDKARGLVQADVAEILFR